MLAKTGLETTAFVGTVSVCALMVDISRLAVYGSIFFTQDFSTVSEGNSGVFVGIATLFAFIGTYTSSKLLKQVTMKTVRQLVGVMLVGIGFSMASGLI